MKSPFDHSLDSFDFSDFFVAPAVQNSSILVGGGPPAPVLGPPIDVPEEFSEAQALVTASGDGGPGSVVTVSGATSAGLTINLVFDAAAMAAPQSFRDGITAAMQMITAVVTDHITLNLSIDYSGTGGGAFGGPSGGNYVAYSTVRADLVNDASAGDTTFNSLPTGSTFAGQSQIAVWYSQEKLWGMISPTGTAIDGNASFATDINPNLLIGVALHELTHAMGRVPYGPQPDVFDFYRFTSPGTNLLNGNSTAPAAYFSLNNGATKLADYGQTSDPSDFLNSGSQGSTDPFNEFYSGSTQQHLTAIDLMQLDALGFHLVGNAPQTVIEALGVTKLVQIGNAYELNPVSGGTGPTVKYLGANITVGQFSGWSPIGAEATASGYEVAWKLAGSDQYTVWNTDANGNDTTQAVNGVSGSSAALESLETSFHQDLNGDGVIGVSAPTGTLIEAKGITELVQNGNVYELDPVSGGSGPTVKYLGAAIAVGQFSGWSPIGAEATATGYEVAWKLAGADQYTVWNTDINGNDTTQAVNSVSGTSAALEALETSFHQDLNGDNVIGIPGGTAVEILGATVLVQAGNVYQLDPVSGGTGPTVKYLGTAITAGQFPGWSPIGAEATATGYEVAWKLAGADQYTVWNTDINGNNTTQAVNSVSGTSAALEALETSFHQDLNGDGIVGIPAHTSPAAQVANIASAAPPPSLGGDDTFTFRADLGAAAGSSGAAPAVLQQIEQAVASGIENLSSEVQHIIASEVQHIIAGDPTGAHDDAARGPLFDLLHGFLIH